MTGPVPTVFFGSGSFAVPILEALLGVARGLGRRRRHGARPARRPAAALRRRRRWRPRALALGLEPCFGRPSAPRAPRPSRRSAALGPGLGVLADYGRIVPPAILDAPGRRHPQRPSVAAAALAGRVADPGHDPGRRHRDRRHGHPDGRRPRHWTDRRRGAVGAWTATEDAPGLEARAAAAGSRSSSRGLSGRGCGARSCRGRRASDGVTMTRPLRREDGPPRSRDAGHRARAPGPGATAVAGHVLRDRSPGGSASSTRSRRGRRRRPGSRARPPRPGRPVRGRRQPPRPADRAAGRWPPDVVGRAAPRPPRAPRQHRLAGPA